jgi:GalNAc-alpha-(1->4)-GalNAc-alpha-(1->3)-diNAcBac-PP-undecaprenol alpha-1,4-N-acetyl-D-galactosaminyltransferase
MRIFLLSSSLNSGGSERVISILANKFSAFFEDVYLITHSKQENDFYEISGKVKRIELSPLLKTSNVIEKIHNNVVAVKELRKCIHSLNPNIIISFLTQVNVRAIMANDRSIPIIISERSNPKRQRIEKVWKILRYLVYRKADKIVIQTDGIRNQLLKIPGTAKKLVILPNPIPDYSFQALESADTMIRKYNLEGRTLIGTMGSLVYPKGHDMLIEAFNKINAEMDCRMVIIGEGDQRSYLSELISRYNLTEKVILMEKMKIFIFSSRYEGFPNALLEAMSLGLPVISFDCETGPREMITNYYNGILVETGNVDKLAVEILNLWKNRALQSKLSQNSKKVVQKYSENIILKQWQDLIYETINHK